MADLTVLSSLPPVPLIPQSRRPFSWNGTGIPRRSKNSLSPPTRNEQQSWSLDVYSSNVMRSRRLSSTSIAEEREEEEASTSSVMILSGPRSDSPAHDREASQSSSASASTSTSTRVSLDTTSMSSYSSSSSVPCSPSSSVPTPDDSAMQHRTRAPSPEPLPSRTTRYPNTRHRPTRSRSAPPFKTTFQLENDSPANSPSSTGSTTPQFTRHRTKRSMTTWNTPTSATRTWSFGYGHNKNELLKPPPPLHRPTTFWRHTPRSGVTSSSYSPSTHLIRRSTFIAAGLKFDKPVCDLSALGVESRIQSPAAYKVREVFWEVVL
ncbi:uncharacterized protein BT62DRAFT_923655 [Guyanagaster necrorhizus]|uniref:Uncharacterized protein n=1 Tax=Guyanagaster necrorhizus TaxID=856835 RepID=A0A9P7VH54_9AGAR|nr:uncharacterized protein BT62DRAFT_923655 [Guyanagaster necrorhizus MCA 3950]KAG7440938.1 hypothetical protein BT62DRAFT_923655 [Guyanagaster necrorhizus MCA 3950]